MDKFLVACKGKRIMVVGDLMLDRYLWGKVERISPEAPVPIVDVYAEENRLGGAANVALNLHSLGAIPILCGYVGEDGSGTELIALASKQGWETDQILISEARRTTVKVRIIGNQQQVLRVDKEDIDHISEEEASRLLTQLLPQVASCDAIVLQDYDKGLLTPFFIQRLITAAKQHQIPLLVDPKFRQFWDYAGCTLFKPNLKELREGLNLQVAADDPTSVIEAMHVLRERMPHAQTLVTLGAYGMVWVSGNSQAEHLAGHPRSIADVSGAGDTVVSVLALGLATDIPLQTAAVFANLAGGLVCESVGVVPIRPEQLQQEHRSTGAQRK